MTERTIFMAAMEIPDPAERAAYLDRACAGDPALRRQLDSLLAAHEREGSFLDSPALAPLVHDGVGQPDGSGDETLALQSRDRGNGRDGLSFLSPSNNPDSLGRLGHYEVLEVVGRGAMGIVLRAFDAKLHRVVAIKVLAPHLASNGTARQRFVREARATAAVSHDNVIAIHAVEEEGPVPYLVMHFVQGQTLQDKLDRTGPPAVKEVLRIGLQTAEGLAAAHKQGLIHRDVKPANILLENGVERVRITDFGLARASDDVSLTQSGIIAGTPQYMSPEQAEAKPVDSRSDLFSLGGVLYALCTGHPPFRGSSTVAVLKQVCEASPRSVREVNPEIPNWLEAIIARLHAKDPAKRYQSAGEVARLLASHLATLQQSSPLPATTEPTEMNLKPHSRRKWLTAAAALLLPVMVVLATWLVVRSLNSGPVATTGGAPTNPELPSTPEQFAKRPSPLDGRKRADLPMGLLALAGGGDPSRAPEELVAVLGDSQFRPLGDHIGGMNCSPDGKLLAVPGRDKVMVFDIKTRQLRQVLPAQSNRTLRAAFSPGSKRVVAAVWPVKGDGYAEMWDRESGQSLQTFRGHQDGVLNAIFGPRAETVITGGIDRTVRIWDADTGKQMHLLQHGDHVHGLAISPDGKYLATGSNDRLVRIWDLATGTLKQSLVGHGGHVAAVTFSPDGKLLASCGAHELRLWNAATFVALRALPSEAAFIAFTADGSTIVGGQSFYADGQHHFVTRWDVASGKKRGDLPLMAQGGWSGYALSPDGKTLFNSRADGPGLLLSAYDAETGAEIGIRHGHVGPVLSVAVSPDGRWLASGGEDHTVRLWDLATGNELRVLRGHTLDVSSLAFSPDGKQLASASHDTTIILWNLARGEEVRTLGRLSRTPSTIAFSPDGQTVAAGSEDGQVKFWDVVTGKARDSIHLHTGSVRAVAYRPDGTQLASCGTDGTVQVVEVATGRLRDTFALGAPGRYVGFSADGRTLVAANDSPGALRLWDLQTRKELAPKEFAASVQPGQISGLALHPGGRLIATSSPDGTVSIWSAGPERQRLLISTAGGAGVRQVAFTTEGRYLATANDNGTISLLRVPTPPRLDSPAPLPVPDPEQLARRRSPADELKREAIPPEVLPENAGVQLVAVLGNRRPQHDGPVRNLRFIDDDKTLVSLGQDNTVRYWDTASGHRQRLVRVNSPEFTGCALSPDGNTLALGYDRSGIVKLWDLRTGKEVHTLANAADRGVLFSSIAFSPDGKKLATGGRWLWFKLWEPATGKELWRSINHGCNTFAFAFTPDGKTVASVNEDHEVTLWDVESGERKKKLVGHQKAVLCVAIAANGRTLATGGVEPTARLWDIDSGEELKSFRGHTAGIGAIALSADGKLLATGSNDRTVKLYDTATGKELATLTGHTEAIQSLSFTADGKTLASGAVDGLVKLWDVETGKERFPHEGHWGSCLAVALAPDGKTLASAGQDGTIRLWDIASSRIALTLTGHFGPVQSVAFSPNGKVLASQGNDGTLRLWDPTTGKAGLVLTGYPAMGSCVVFSPDSRLLAIAEQGGAITLRDVATGKRHRTLLGLRGEAVRLAFSPNGKYLAGVGAEGARVWDVASGWQVAEIRGPARGYADLAFHPDGQVLALATHEQLIELRDPWDGAHRGTLPTAADTVAFRGDGRLVVSSQHNGIVTFWSLVAGRVPGKRIALPVGVNGVALTPEGRYLATANADGTVFVLRLANLGEVFQVPAEQ